MKTAAQLLGEAITADLERYPNISQETVARELDVTQQAVSNWKTGASLPRGARMIRLGEVFPAGSATHKVIHQLRNHLAHGPSGPLRGVDPTDLAGILGASASLERAGNSARTRDGFAEPLKWAQESRTSMGEQASSERRRSTDVVEEHAPSHYIPSFEVQPAADVRDSLTRAKNGLTLARQVLEDATTQVDRALASLK